MYFDSMVFCVEVETLAGAHSLYFQQGVTFSVCKYVYREAETKRPGRAVYLYFIVGGRSDCYVPRLGLAKSLDVAKVRMFCIRGLRQGCSLFLVGKPKNFRYTALIRSNTHRYWRCAGPFRWDIRLKLIFQNLGLHGVQNSLMREVASRLDHALARRVRSAWHAHGNALLWTPKRRCTFFLLCGGGAEL